MLSERGGWGNSNRQDVCAFLTKTVPSLLHSFNSHPSPHPCHASSLHLKHTHTQKRNDTFMFHSSALCLLLLHWCQSSTSVAFSLFCFCLFVLSVAFFLYKKKLFFLVSVRQSVCLSVFVHVAVFLAVWLQVESGVTQWATSSGGF